MRKTSALAVLAIVALIAMPIGCATSNGYAAASQKYDANSIAYDAAFKTLQSSHDAGRLPAPTWSQFLTLSAAERVADAAAHADLIAWKASGKEPTFYWEHAQSLLDAQNAVIALAAGAPR